jgi:hypothetical protein
MPRHTMETRKIVTAAKSEDRLQVSPTDPLVGELLVANIMGDSIGKQVPPIPRDCLDSADSHP